ncbi:hypothetical protein BD410DRAFT_546314 [Rickenella mellea]|uniref:Uncharacterized protein n=1 Tax=Rickenella mellea TaxID=50990 RepID=A0A4Y7PR00_9AGAM|nr:hypothetical protein BD410DRAFT_546314 [Rickenella mellea]
MPTPYIRSASPHCVRKLVLLAFDVEMVLLALGVLALLVGPNASQSTPSPTPAPSPSVTIPSTSVSLPPATYTPAPPPVAPVGATNTSVSALDPRIQYSPNWQTTNLCSGTSKSCGDAGQTMTFQFSGSAIFMNLNNAPTGMVYSATVDGVTDVVDAFRQGQDCGVGWSRFNLDNQLHVLNITILGPSSQTPASSISQASLDVTSLVVTSQASGTGSTSSPKPTSSALPSNMVSWVAAVTIAMVCAGISKLFI